MPNAQFYLGLAIGMVLGLLVPWARRRIAPLLCKLLPHTWEHLSWVKGDRREMICTRCGATEIRYFRDNTPVT